MKNLKNVLYFLLLFVTVISCTKVEPQNKKEPASSEIKSSSTDLYYSNVRSTLLTLGYSEVTPPPTSYTPATDLTDYDRFEYWSNGVEDRVVYVWDSPNAPGMEEAKGTCDWEWISSGDLAGACKSVSSNCRLNEKKEIVCCD